jgi:2-amino-4-hydroxy-6-hydroxymethyldihydropteridine diphosphokinase
MSLGQYPARLLRRSPAVSNCSAGRGERSLLSARSEEEMNTQAHFAEALLALGGNIGDVRETFDRAIAMVCADGAVRLIARSSDYRTPPWGVADQPPFINAAIIVTTSLDPRALLTRALAVERAHGRDRANERRWGPRSIDIDILAYDDFVLSEPDLTLPHPHLFERGFVLLPLAEIASDRVIAGRRIDDALAGADVAGIEKLPLKEAKAPR